jgi:uncharacterized damage-inducible protein DinB
MIIAIEKNLQRGIQLLNSLSDDEYSDCSVAPYYSSIGNHIRHVLDVFACVFDGLEKGKVDFCKREKDVLAETKRNVGLRYFETTIEQLHNLKENSFHKKITIYDDLGCGKTAAEYTLGSALMQAQSHAIHHFATIGYIINQLNISLPVKDFGYNPTSEIKAS